MKKINAYKTSDGFLTEDKKEAENRQKDINLKQAVEKIIDDCGWNGMSKDDAVDIIIDNKEEFKKCLSFQG